jgi:putative heme transporter
MSTEPRLLAYGKRAWAVLGIVGVLVVVSWAAQQVSLVLTAFVLALFPAALFSPLAERLRRTRMPNPLTAVLLVVLLVMLFVVPGWLVIPRFVAQAPELADAVLAGLEELESGIDWTILPGNVQRPADLVEQAFNALSDAEVWDRGIAALTAAVNIAIGLVLLLVVVFFCFKDGRRLWQGVLDLLPERHQPRVDLLAQRAWWNLGAYLRGQLLVALFDAVFIGLGLWLLGVPLALPLAVLVFFGGLFPIVGAFVSGGVAVLVALADQGLTTAILTLVLIVLVQQIETNVFQPVIMSNIVAIHPLVIILSITTGALLFGILGAFLAVPVAAITGRIVDELRGRPPAAGPRPSAAAEPPTSS